MLRYLVEERRVSESGIELGETEAQIHVVGRVGSGAVAAAGQGRQQCGTDC